MNTGEASLAPGLDGLWCRLESAQTAGQGSGDAGTGCTCGLGSDTHPWLLRTPGSCAQGPLVTQQLQRRQPTPHAPHRQPSPGVPLSRPPQMREGAPGACCPPGGTHEAGQLCPGQFSLSGPEGEESWREPPPCALTARFPPGPSVLVPIPVPGGVLSGTKRGSQRVCAFGV